jgi:hypothetical protein
VLVASSPIPITRVFDWKEGCGARGVSCVVRARAQCTGFSFGQTRTLMLILRKAHVREVTVSVWPKILKEICAQKNIRVLE